MMIGVLIKVYFPHHGWLLSVILCQGLAQACNYYYTAAGSYTHFQERGKWKSKSEKIRDFREELHSQPT